MDEGADGPMELVIRWLTAPERTKPPRGSSRNSHRPRAAFIAYHARRPALAAMVCHRRAGKTVAAVNELIKRALTRPLARPRTAYIAPCSSRRRISPGNI